VSDLPAALTRQAQAEQQLADASKDLKQAQDALADANRELGEAHAQLRVAWDREHALANTLRNERLMR
jgi:F0F1-type ATP synthase membrane subunit b/b'